VEGSGTGNKIYFSEMGIESVEGHKNPKINIGELEEEAAGTGDETV